MLCPDDAATSRRKREVFAGVPYAGLTERVRKVTPLHESPDGTESRLCKMLVEITLSAAR